MYNGSQDGGNYPATIQGQTADDYVTESEWAAANGGTSTRSTVSTRDMSPTFQAPARSSGRIAHMALALEAMQLSQRCRVSHPKLAVVLEALADTAIAEQRVSDEGRGGASMTLLAASPVRGRAADLARVIADEAHAAAEQVAA